MKEKRIKFTIDPKGTYTMETIKGFSGTSCIEQTKFLEIAIGGSTVAEGKTDAYYHSDEEAPVTINM